MNSSVWASWVGRKKNWVFLSDFWGCFFNFLRANFFLNFLSASKRQHSCFYRSFLHFFTFPKFHFFTFPKKNSILSILSTLLLIIFSLFHFSQKIFHFVNSTPIIYYKSNMILNVSLMLDFISCFMHLRKNNLQYKWNPD